MISSQIVLLFALASVIVAIMPSCPDTFPPFDLGETTCTTAGSTSASCAAPNVCTRLTDGTLGCCWRVVSACGDAQGAAICANYASQIQFCTNTAYSLAIRKLYCGATCKLC